MSTKSKGHSKNTSRYNKSKNIKDKQITNIWLLLPIILIMSIIPFTVRLKEYQTNLSNFPWFTYNDIYRHSY